MTGPKVNRLLCLLVAVCVPAVTIGAHAAVPIDRETLVARHHVLITNIDEQQALQVGNGEFAFGVDVTGLQSLYGHTMSQWGWHRFPLPTGLRVEDFTPTPWDVHGRTVSYATDAKGQEHIYQWLRENPHRINLGRIALRLGDRLVSKDDLSEVRQTLDLWRGLITSSYRLAGEKTEVETCCHPTRDLVAIQFSRPMTVEVAFPYGSPGLSGANWQKPEAHATVATISSDRADLERRLDADGYAVSVRWNTGATFRQTGPHTFVVANVRSFVCAFSRQEDASPLPNFEAVKTSAAAHWSAFWRSGGAIDLSASKDPRWRELERRIVLSQYLLAVNEAGSLPPQESGLFNNGWNGKFHIEMHWWHGVHYALWDRWPMFEKSLGWYAQILPVAREIAARQGYGGARWPKMVGPDGHDAPSGVGPLLIWQQPHPIYYAELDYRRQPSRATLEKWRDIVFSSAEFMASYAFFDKDARRFVLGPPMKTVPENTPPREARNPTFELSYWRTGLRLAQQWRERLGLPREAEWDQVAAALAPLPQHEGVYLLEEGMTNTFTKWNWEHPSLVGPLGMLPGDGADPAIMRATVQKVWATWQWDRKTWGWDFPMLAMAAARNGEPQIAVDALLHPAPRNGMLVNGLSTGGPFPYFPSNGGLLAAVAMMAAGWDGAPTNHAPGFPSDGQWTVQWEGLKPLP